MSLHSYGSIVSGNVDYQIFRDFAENKGAFHPGATGITVHNKDMSHSITLDVPMPDFSSVTMGKSVYPDTGLKPGIATLISPQYIVSVAHNRGHFPVKFGYQNSTKYNMNTREDNTDADFMAGRLDKLVTEVCPAIITDNDNITDNNTSSFSRFYRVGGGTQKIWKDNKSIEIPNAAYMYLTGGTTPEHFTTHGAGQMQTSMPGDIYTRDILSSHLQQGDSGSPLFGWDSSQNRWELVGIAEG
ncbi:S6 family peptidase, partial [Escherichia coli]|uniref:S6 family peptidase n=4 Tax=Escherichia coli TaxID=562 RepID=UPI0024C15093